MKPLILGGWQISWSVLRCWQMVDSWRSSHSVLFKLNPEISVDVSFNVGSVGLRRKWPASLQTRCVSCSAVLFVCSVARAPFFTLTTHGTETRPKTKQQQKREPFLIILVLHKNKKLTNSAKQKSKRSDQRRENKKESGVFFHVSMAEHIYRETHAWHYWQIFLLTSGRLS